MKLTFIGAAHEVTGSLHYLETEDCKILVDCGMEQGRNVYENAPEPFNYGDIDYILLTHAHIDHAGMLPRAHVLGFNGTVLTTEASLELDRIMLLDSASIQEKEAQAETKKKNRRGAEGEEPVYTVDDAAATMEHFRAVPYNEMTELSDCVSVRFIDAGHLLGSASVEVWIKEDGEEKKIVFSGDIGNKGKPLIRDPEYIKEADFVVMESTYGDRYHDDCADHIEDLRRIVQKTLDAGGNIVFPAFAVGRTQELLYLFRQLKMSGAIKGHDGFPVYVDSPLAVEATKVFDANLWECFDEETAQLVKSGVNPIMFDDLVLSVSTEESKAINEDPVPKVIIAAAGMCNAGRIKYHLKYNLWRPESSVVFAGYQADGTLGRQLQDGAENVKIFGEKIVVRAGIETMPDMSSHADAAGLVEWASAFNPQPEKFILVHGDDEAMAGLKQKLEEKLGAKVECPFSGSVFNLKTGEFDRMTDGVPIVRAETEEASRNNEHRKNLASALDGLSALVEKQKQGTNKDMDALARAIAELTEEYCF